MAKRTPLISLLSLLVMNLRNHKSFDKKLRNFAFKQMIGHLTVLAKSVALKKPFFERCTKWKFSKWIFLVTPGHWWFSICFIDDLEVIGTHPSLAHATFFSILFARSGKKKDRYVQNFLP